MNNSKNNLNFDNKSADLLGRVILKIHYLKINIFASFYTLINKCIWLIKGLKLGVNVKFYGFSKAFRYPGSHICIGNNCSFRSDKFSNLIGINRRCIISTHGHTASIKVGNNCGFSGVTIGCLESIIIGNNVLVGANVIITDFDWHNVDPLRRKETCTSSKPVYIEDNVFIGVNSIIWKGVIIGKNSVIGANSVVTKSIPENCIAAGNPARVIKSI